MMPVKKLGIGEDNRGERFHLRPECGARRVPALLIDVGIQQPLRRGVGALDWRLDCV
jgi:hypothetical protein